MIEKLSLEIVEFRARLWMNARDSSKPSPSDGYEKPAPESCPGRVQARSPASNPAISPGDLWCDGEMFVYVCPWSQLLIDVIVPERMCSMARCNMLVHRVSKTNATAAEPYLPPWPG